jgi:hypothetical protein
MNINHEYARIDANNTNNLQVHYLNFIRVIHWTCLTTRLVVKQVLHFFGLKRTLARKNAIYKGSCLETEVSKQLYSYLCYSW